LFSPSPAPAAALPCGGAETAHYATTLCPIVSICRLLDRKLKRYPAEEQFIGDDEANRILPRPRREGCELPKV
jgi:hypothetical protein